MKVEMARQFCIKFSNSIFHESCLLVLKVLHENEKIRAAVSCEAEKDVSNRNQTYFV
jgi:hypothetical protein